MKSVHRLNSLSGISSKISAILLVVVFNIQLVLADPPKALPKKAPLSSFKWQPATDYDTDGCYPTAAVDKKGKAAEGLKVTGALNGNCRDRSDLTNSNSYVRRKCSGKFCAYMYAYYFEKDQGTVAGCTTLLAIFLPFRPCGHRHDFEHVVVWVQRGKAKYVSVSHHKVFKIKAAKDIRWKGTHPKIIYHKDGGLTHAFRFANRGDDNIENHSGKWHFPALRTWKNLPGKARKTLNNHNFGSANLGIRDSNFNDTLRKAKPNGIDFNPGA